MNLPVKRPTEFSPALVDEERIIDCVATQVAMVRHKLGTEYGLEFMADTLRNALREGRQPLTNYTIEAAEKRGDEICDAALRTVYLELASRRLLERGPSGSLPIRREEPSVSRWPSTRFRNGRPGICSYWPSGSAR
jgi:hypothetical protein